MIFSPIIISIASLPYCWCNISLSRYSLSHHLMIWNNQDELNDLLLLTPQQWSAWIVLSVTDLIGAQLADVCWCYVSESWIGIAKSWLLRQALSFLIKQCLPSQTFICIILIDIWQVMLKIMPSSRPNNSILTYCRWHVLQRQHSCRNLW